MSDSWRDEWLAWRPSVDSTEFVYFPSPPRYRQRDWANEAGVILLAYAPWFHLRAVRSLRLLFLYEEQKELPIDGISVRDTLSWEWRHRCTVSQGLEVKVDSIASKLELHPAFRGDRAIILLGNELPLHIS